MFSRRLERLMRIVLIENIKITTLKNTLKYQKILENFRETDYTHS